MAKTKSSFINMVVTLLVVTAVASLALAGVYDLTYEPIQKVKREKRARRVILHPLLRMVMVVAMEKIKTLQ